MSKKGSDARTYNISVIGLSGVDNEKSFYGVGKSCLCNRFVRPLADEYIAEHLSIYSVTDFAGRVLNNDHYLYWGSVVKRVDEDSDLCFQIIEQTEFIEDSTFSVLSRGGQLTPYTKRCTALRLQSPEKLMYISRDQVALQNDYEQVALPNGKFNVDGFVCVFDASVRCEDQESFYSNLLNSLQKTKKPFVVAATKCDDIRRNSLEECTKLFSSKKLTNVPIIEVSAQENINVDLVFLLLAQLIEKGKARSRIIPYDEAYQYQKDRINGALENYQKLVESKVSDFGAIWKNTKKLFENEPEYLTVKDLCGIDSCKRVFNKYIRRLKKEAEDIKLEEYMIKLPAALNDIFPTLASLEGKDWLKAQTTIRDHKDFDKWFVHLSNGNSWQDSENLLSKTFHIPIDVLTRDEAKNCFEEHIDKLKEAELCSRMKKEFIRLLQLTPQIQPGTPWQDGVLLLKNEESYKYLSDKDKLDIFETYQTEITLQAKSDFQELLFESAKLFANFGPKSQPTLANLHQISNELQKDERYRRLDKFVTDREKLLWNHIALLHSPSRCLAGEGKCMDSLIQDVVATTDQRPISSFLAGSNDTFESDDSLVTIVVVGSDGLAKDFAQGVEKRCYGEHFEYPFENKLYELDIKIEEDDNVSDVFNELDDISTTGLCCVFSSRESLTYVDQYLEKTVGQSDDILREDVPVVLLLAQDSKEKDVQNDLRSRAQELVKRYRCVFIDIHISHFYRDQLITDTQVDEAIKSVLEGIKLQSRSRCTSEDFKEPDPDLRILLCANCGDPFPVELILGPLFTNQSCSKAPNRNDSVMLETFVGAERKKVMITFTSYHRAYSLNYQKFHGYILVYSAVRSASLSTLSVFASSIPTIPIQVLATTGSYSGASVVFHSDVAKTLLADGTNLASKLCAKFQTTSPQFQHQAGAFTVFFNRVWEKKKESEAAYAEHLLTMSDTLSRKHRPLPVPPSPKTNEKKKRERSLSDRHYEPLTFRTVDVRGSTGSLDHRHPPLEVSVVDDGELSPYAVVVKRPSSLPSNQPFITSTPNAGSVEDVDPYASSTPLKREIAEMRKESQPLNQPLYSKVDKSKIRRAIQEQEGFSGTPKNPDRHSEVFVDSDMDNAAPEVPERTVHGDVNVQDIKDNPEPGYAIVREGSLGNNHDEGYSTVDDTSQRGAQTPSQSSDPFQMGMQKKIEYFKQVAKCDLPPASSSRSFPSDSLQRLRSNKQVPSLIKHFSVSAPLAQAEESEVPDYASVKDVEQFNKNFQKNHRHSTIPEVTTKTENVVLRLGNKDISRHVKSVDEATLSELMGHAGNVAAQKRMDSRRSPTERIPNILCNDFSHPDPINVTIDLRSPNLPTPNYSICSDDGQTADDEATLDRSKKLRMPSFKQRDKRKNSPIQARKFADIRKRASRERKRIPKDLKENKNVSRSHSVPRNFNPVKLRLQPPFTDEQKTKHNSLSVESRTVSPMWPADEGESFTEEETEDDSINRKRKQTRDAKEAEKNRKREEKKEKRRHEKEIKTKKKKEERIRKKEEEFRRKKMSKASSKYFGQSLSVISSENFEVPLFITKCIEYVENFGMEIKGLYRVSGNKADVETVQQKFEEDQSKDFAEFGVTLHAITGALKSFFTKLPGALIPSDCYEGIIRATMMMDAQKRFTELRRIMKMVPPQNYSVFRYLMFHLNRVTEYKSVNMMESRNLAIVFWPTLAPPVVTSIDNMARSMNMCLFVQTYIEHCEELFKDD